MRVCICGGGAIGHVAAAVLGARIDCEVTMLTRRPGHWRHRIEIHVGDHYRMEGRLQRIVDAPEDCIPDADVVLLAVPAQVRLDVLRKIAPYLAPQIWLGCLGTGIGFDTEVASLRGLAARFFGVQRTPWVARVDQSGRRVVVSGVRDKVLIAGSPVAPLSALAAQLGPLLGLTFRISSNYMDVALSYDNSTLHPPRLYSLFGPAQYARRGHGFYRDWNCAASQCLLDLDTELGTMRRALAATGAASARAHFGSGRAQDVTASLRTSAVLRAIGLPLLAPGFEDETPKPDLHSRFFQEDLLFGLAWQTRLANEIGIAMPQASALVDWGKAMMLDQESREAIPC